MIRLLNGERPQKWVTAEVDWLERQLAMLADEIMTQRATDSCILGEAVIDVKL
jgi:hypothetical protein